MLYWRHNRHLHFAAELTLCRAVLELMYIYRDRLRVPIWASNFLSLGAFAHYYQALYFYTIQCRPIQHSPFHMSHEWYKNRAMDFCAVNSVDVVATDDYNGRYYSNLCYYSAMQAYCRLHLPDSILQVADNGRVHLHLFANRFARVR